MEAKQILIPVVAVIVFVGSIPAAMVISAKVAGVDKLFAAGRKFGSNLYGRSGFARAQALKKNTREALHQGAAEEAHNRRLTGNSIMARVRRRSIAGNVGGYAARNRSRLSAIAEEGYNKSLQPSLDAVGNADALAIMATARNARDVQRRIVALRGGNARQQQTGRALENALPGLANQLGRTPFRQAALASSIKSGGDDNEIHAGLQSLVANHDGDQAELDRAVSTLGFTAKQNGKQRFARGASVGAGAMRHYEELGSVNPVDQAETASGIIRSTKSAEWGAGQLFTSGNAPTAIGQRYIDELAAGGPDVEGRLVEMAEAVRGGGATSDELRRQFAGIATTAGYGTQFNNFLVRPPRT